MKKVFVILLILISCQKNIEDGKTKLASIGNKIIKKEEFEDYLLKNLGKEPYKNTAVVLSELLDNFIKEKLLDEEAKRKGFEGEKAEERIKNFLMEICSKLEKPEEKHVYDWYLKNKDQFWSPTQYFFWQIFISDKKKAEEVYKKIKEGEDFLKLLNEYSESANKEKGGLIGPLSLEDLPEEIALGLSKLKKGEISQLLPVASGYMILKLKEIKKEGFLTYEEVKDKIYGYLKEELCEKERKRIEKELILKEQIWIYQKNLPFYYSGQFPVME